MAGKSKVEKVQDRFISMLVDLQKRAIESGKQPQRYPSLPMTQNDARSQNAGLIEPQKRARKKATKKQLKALSKGREVLAQKRSKGEKDN